MLRRLAEALVLGIALAYAVAWLSEGVLSDAFDESHLVGGAFAFAALVSLLGVYLTTRRWRRDIDRLIAAAEALPLGRFVAPPSAFARELQPLTRALSGAAATLDKQRRRATALLDVAATLSKAHGPADVLDGLHAKLHEVLHLGHLVLIRLEASRLIVVATSPAPAGMSMSPDFMPPVIIDPPVLKALLESQQTHLLSQNDAPHLAGVLDQCAARADHFALVPLAAEQRIKYILLVSPDASRRYTSADVAFLDVLASQVGGAFALGELYADLQNQNAALLKANSAKSEFLASMSHELRTPLNSILGFSEVLLGQQFGSLSERQHRYVDHINTGGRHLLALINDLLDLSKVDTGRLEINAQNCSLQSIFQEAIATAQMAAAARSVRIILSFGPLPTVLADPTRIRQVLHSVLSDAIRSSPARGEVTIEYALRDNQRRVRLSIKHAGTTSYDRSQAASIMAAGAPVPASAVISAGTSPGLGIALARRLVEAMEGSFSIAATPDDGTAYTIELPRQLPTYPELPALSAAQISPLALIVDDDAMARTMIDVQLRASGYRTLSAGTGEEALVLARSAKPDLITLDVFLPGIDGWDVLRVLRGDASTGAIPVLMVSLDGDSDKAVQLGASGHLRKPIDAADLQRLVAEARAASAAKGG